MKVESCQKSRRNLDVFSALPNFRGRAFRKLYARYHPSLATRRLEKFHEDIPTSAEVIGLHTLNFKPNFKFSRLIFILFFLGGGPPSQLGCALGSLGQSLARFKIWAQHSLRAEILCAEKFPLGWVNMHLYNFLGRPKPPFRTGLCFTADVSFFCFATRSPSSLDRSP